MLSRVQIPPRMVGNSGSKKLNSQPFRPVTRPSQSQDDRDTTTNAQNHPQSSFQQTRGRTTTNRNQITPSAFNHHTTQTGVTFARDTIQRNDQSRLRSPPPPQQATTEGALPESITDEFLDSCQEHIPLLYIHAANSMYVHDTGNDIYFLVDTGAERSIIPATNRDKETPERVHLIAANGTHVNTYGEANITLTFGRNRKFNWKFVIADVTESILGADFLKHHNLLVDLGKKRLIDRQTQTQVNAIIPEPFSAIIQRFPTLTRIDSQAPTNPDTTHFW